jgi:hypothetical protein
VRETQLVGNTMGGKPSLARALSKAAVTSEMQMLESL